MSLSDQLLDTFDGGRLHGSVIRLLLIAAHWVCPACLCKQCHSMHMRTWCIQSACISVAVVTAPLPDRMCHAVQAHPRAKLPTVQAHKNAPCH